jgi:hypothetical protein
LRGTIHNRSGERYKPASLRAYEGSMRLHVLPALGGARLDKLNRPQLQRYVHGLQAAGLAPSTVRGAVLPLRAIFNHAVAVGDLNLNPCDGLRLPNLPTGRDRIAILRKRRP